MPDGDLTIAKWQPELLPTLSGALLLQAVINGYVLPMAGKSQRGDGSDFLPPIKPLEVSGWLLPARFTISGLAHDVEATMVCHYDDAHTERLLRTMRKLGKLTADRAKPSKKAQQQISELFADLSRESLNAQREQLRDGAKPKFTELALVPRSDGKRTGAHHVVGVQWKSAMRMRISQLSVRPHPSEPELHLPTRAITQQATQACGFEGTLLTIDGETVLRIERFGMARRMRATNRSRVRLTKADHEQTLQLYVANVHGSRIKSVAHGLQVTERTAHYRIRESKDALPEEWRKAKAKSQPSRKPISTSTKKGKRR